MFSLSQTSKPVEHSCSPSRPDRLCQRDGNEFKLAYIPSDFAEEPTVAFDPVYMKKLLGRGHQMALEDYPWEKAPPDFILKP